MIDYENLSSANTTLLKELEAASLKVIRKGWYILGEEVEAFETEFAKFVGTNYCIGVGNGLDAIVLSLVALELPSGSDILVASNTYIATIISILRAGHRPILVEPNPGTYNIDPSRVLAAVTPKTRAICITHMFGKACEVDKIISIAKAFDLKLIEDCAQSHGAKFKDKVTGSFGDLGCFSFYPTKNLGALGDGGAIVTNDQILAERVRCLRNYGSPQKYEFQHIGYNSRLDEIQAAFLRVKLKHINQLVTHKRMLADIYFNHLPEWLIKPTRNPKEFDVFHIFAIRHHNRDELQQWLLKNGVKTEIHYPIPPHRQIAMKDILLGDYPIADLLHTTELSLPISLMHDEDDILRICALINGFPMKK